jgi:hypothetical protein
MNPSEGKRGEKRKTARRRALLAGILLAAWGLSGCIAIPLGGNQQITGTWTDQKPSETTRVDSAVLRETAVSRGNDALEVGLDLEVTETTTRKQRVHSVTVTKRKWVTVGVFPSFGEVCYAPKNGLQAEDNFHFPDFFSFYLAPILSFVIWPFESAECTTHYWKGPNAESLLRLSAADRAKIGARIEGDGLPPLEPDAAQFCHSIFVGCLKHCTYVVSDPVEKETGESRKTERRERMQGPYDAELRIPALNWTVRGSVERGMSRTVLDLPFAFPPGTYEAQLRFLFSRERIAAEKSEAVRRALEEANGKKAAIRFRIQE